MYSLVRAVTLHQIVLLYLQKTSAEVEPRFFSPQDWQTAGHFMGLDTTQGVGSLVSSALTHSQLTSATKQDSALQHSLFHSFFRLLGFDTTKLNAIAINAVVFIAKMIGSTLMKNFSSEGVQKRNLGKEEDTQGSPLSWILDDVKIQSSSLLSRAQEQDLPDQLISSLQSVPGETDCIQLLVCRASPLLSGMRRSLHHLLSDTQTWTVLAPLQRMYHYMPTRGEFLEAATTCAKKIPSCTQLFDAFEH